MRSTKSPNLELFGERTSSIERNVKLKVWASFCSFFLRSLCTQIFHYQHKVMTDKSINIEQVKALNLSASTKTCPPEHIYKHDKTYQGYVQNTGR